MTIMPRTIIRRQIGAGRGRQGGVALFIALIALIAMSMAGLALMRAVDTANVISGNLAFQQAALQATDEGVEAAVTTLATITGSALDSNYPTGSSTGGFKYYPTIQSANSLGIPTVINWNNVTSTTVNGKYKVKYVIDRLCDGPTPVTDIAGKCYVDQPLGGGTKKVGSSVFSGSQKVYYRVTVRVEGPRNTVSIVQAILAR